MEFKSVFITLQVFSSIIGSYLLRSGSLTFHLPDYSAKRKYHYVQDVISVSQRQKTKVQAGCLMGLVE